VRRRNAHELRELRRVTTVTRSELPHSVAIRAVARVIVDLYFEQKRLERDKLNVMESTDSATNEDVA